MEDKLIVAISARPFIYDRSSILFKDRKERVFAWKLISKEVGMSGKFFKYLNTSNIYPFLS